jgi:hypothetical protein
MIDAQVVLIDDYEVALTFIQGASHIRVAVYR